jgi:LmbE family N-acetylglucosaminyl deacetylase
VSGAVVAVVAHPDDESLIAGGTLALAAQAGLPTGVVCLTRGESGPIATPKLVAGRDLGEVRARELDAAAAELGVAWAACLHHPDGELPWVDLDAAADELAALLAPHAPAVVLTFGEDGLYWHPDHIATRDIAALAVARLVRPAELLTAVWPHGEMTQLVDAAKQRGLPTGLWGLEPQSFGSDASPTLVFDVRPVLARKLAALRAHRSQIGPDHLLARLPDDLAERFLGTERWSGRGTGALKEMLGA